MPLTHKSRRGQAGLEYMALAVFVMAGIIIGGPYVVRSVNSHFKSVEEGSVDADREKIVQGPSSLTLPACTCGNLGGTACGDGSGGCSKRQKLLTRSCTPLGCQAGLPPGMQPEMTRCVDDPTNTCCEAVTNTGACGSSATHASCLPGEMENKKLCGTPGAGTYIYGCAPSSSCTTGCNPPGPNTTAAIWCDPVNYQNPPLLSSAIRAVENGHCLDDLDMRCKIECNATSTVVGAGCMPQQCGAGLNPEWVLKCYNSTCNGHPLSGALAAAVAAAGSPLSYTITVYSSYPNSGPLSGSFPSAVCDSAHIGEKALSAIRSTGSSGTGGAVAGWQCQCPSCSLPSPNIGVGCYSCPNGSTITVTFGIGTARICDPIPGTVGCNNFHLGSGWTCGGYPGPICESAGTWYEWRFDFGGACSTCPPNYADKYKLAKNQFGKYSLNGTQILPTCSSISSFPCNPCIGPSSCYATSSGFEDKVFACDGSAGDAQCGLANNGSYANQPPTADLCTVGSAGNVLLLGGTWHWACDLVRGEPIDCSATKP